jgi:hypothetical protein
LGKLRNPQAACRYSDIAVKRTLRSLVGPHATCDYLAHYDMNHTTPERRARFLSKVKDVFEAW